MNKPSAPGVANPLEYSRLLYVSCRVALGDSDEMVSGAEHDPEHSVLKADGGGNFPINQQG